MKIIIADDQKILRDCLKHMIEEELGFEVVATASNGKEAVELSLKHLPDVVLMDILMPECNGIEATKQIKEKNENIKILVLSASSNDSDVLEAISKGADGYVLKDISREDLMLAIKSVFSGMKTIQKDVYRIVERHSNNDIAGANGKRYIQIDDFKVELAERELKLIELIVEGKSTSDIAAILFIAEGRVRNIITEILAKLMLTDRTQLAVFAIKNNLVQI